MLVEVTKIPKIKINKNKKKIDQPNPQIFKKKKKKTNKTNKQIKKK